MTEPTDEQRLRRALGRHFNIWQLLEAPRAENVAEIRALCRTVAFGRDTALTRVLGRYQMFIDTRDNTISPHLVLEGYWEMWVTEAMLRVIRPGMTCLDIGANLGYFSVLMADLVGPTGRVLAFEPNLDMASRARRSLSINGMSWATLHEVALGGHDGDMVFEADPNAPGGGHMLPEAAMIADRDRGAPSRAAAAALAAPVTAMPIPRGIPPEPLPRPVLPAPPPPAPGLLAAIARSLGFVPAGDVAASRAAAEAAIADATTAIAAATAARIEAAIAEAATAAELAHGARLAAIEAAAAAAASAEATRATLAEVGSIVADRIAAFHNPAGAVARRSVPLRRLDSFPEALDADVIKMDVEGFEPSVWAGMDALLARGRAVAIFMEFTLVRLADPHGFLDRIAAHGFHLHVCTPDDGVRSIPREWLWEQPHHIDHMLFLIREARP